MRNPTTGERRDGDVNYNFYGVDSDAPDDVTVGSGGAVDRRDAEG